MQTPINAWILNKIVNFLKDKEGCYPVYSPKDTLEGMQVEVVDAFGYRYEVSIKTIGRRGNEDSKDLVTKITAPVLEKI